MKITREFAREILSCVQYSFAENGKLLKCNLSEEAIELSLNNLCDKNLIQKTPLEELLYDIERIISTGADRASILSLLENNFEAATKQLKELMG